MELYATSKNTGPSWGSDPLHLLYIGNSLAEAEDAVGDFRKYERKPGEPHYYASQTGHFSALPRNMTIKTVKFYGADGWWYSIVKFDLEDN